MAEIINLAHPTTAATIHKISSLLLLVPAVACSSATPTEMGPEPPGVTAGAGGGVNPPATPAAAGSTSTGGSTVGAGGSTAAAGSVGLGGQPSMGGQSNTAAGSSGAGGAMGAAGGAGGETSMAGGGGGGMGGGGSGLPMAPEPATWSHTECDKAALDFPDIDKNNGVFPIGSCPPPEDLYRDCGGTTKLTVMASEASTWEDGYWHPAEYAHDEYMMTRWSSFSRPSGEWLQLDLGSEHTIQRLYLAWELAHGADYDIEASNDAQTWTTIGQVRGGDGYQDIVDVEGSGRYIRIMGLVRGMTDTGGEVYGYSLFDVTICGQ